MIKICLIGYSVDEINGLDIARLQGLGASGTPTLAPAVVDVNGSGSAFPAPVVAVLNHAEASKPFLVAFTKDVTAWPNVVLAARSGGKYVRFDKSGSASGSFAYLRPGGTLSFRLAEVPQGFSGAFLRKVQDNNP